MNTAPPTSNAAAAHVPGSETRPAPPFILGTHTGNPDGVDSHTGEVIEIVFNPFTVTAVVKIVVT
jgi:hypothetical protein